MPGNFRFLFVRAQMGLLQEGLLTRRLCPALRAEITAGQSGYVRGTEDPHLLLFELQSIRVALGMCLWATFGDYVKAFPRTWRADLLDMVLSDGHTHGGAMALLGDMLSGDVLHIWLSGSSVVDVFAGLPEGGTLGPALYPGCLSHW